VQGKNFDCRGGCAGLCNLLVNEISISSVLDKSYSKEFRIDNSLAKFISLVLQILAIANCFSKLCLTDPVETESCCMTT